MTTYNIAEKMANQLLQRYIIHVCSHNNRNSDPEDEAADSTRWAEVAAAARGIASAATSAVGAAPQPPSPRNISSPRAGSKSCGPIVPRAPSTATAIHNQSELHAAVLQLARRYPILPRDTPRSEMMEAQQQQQQLRLPSGSTGGSGGMRHPTPRSDTLDLRPVDSLTPRSMFPPLQRLTPRSSTEHTNLRTASSQQLQETEHRLNVKIPKAQVIFADTYKRRHGSSTRSKRNIAAIQSFKTSQTSGMSAEQLQQEDEEVLKEMSSGRRRAPRFSAEQIESVMNQKQRYGLHFCAPTVPQRAHGNVMQLAEAAMMTSSGSGVGGAGAATSSSLPGATSGASLLLMTDALLDRLKEKEQQRTTREILDREAEARRRKLEQRRMQKEKDLAVEREQSAHVAEELQHERAQRLQKREEQKKLAGELQRAAEMRRAKLRAQVAEKEHFAESFRSENEAAREEEETARAKARRKREAVSRANCRLAEDRRAMLAQSKEHERELERQELATRLKEV